MDWLVELFSIRLANLELYRWLFFLSVWLPWLIVELLYFRRMRRRLREREKLELVEQPGGDSEG